MLLALSCSGPFGSPTMGQGGDREHRPLGPDNTKEKGTSYLQRHCSGTSLHGFGVTGSSNTPWSTFLGTEPFARCRAVTCCCHVAAGAEDFS